MVLRSNRPDADRTSAGCLLMGLLLLEVIADAGAPLHELVEDLLADVGPAQYARTDLKLTRPVAKRAMVKMLVDAAPKEISGVSLEDVQTMPPPPAASIIHAAELAK